MRSRVWTSCTASCRVDVGLEAESYGMILTAAQFRRCCLFHGRTCLRHLRPSKCVHRLIIWQERYQTLRWLQKTPPMPAPYVPKSCCVSSCVKTPVNLPAQLYFEDGYSIATSSPPYSSCSTWCLLPTLQNAKENDSRRTYLVCLPPYASSIVTKENNQ